MQRNVVRFWSAKGGRVNARPSSPDPTFYTGTHMRYILTPHSVRRFRERHAKCNALDDDRIRVIMHAQLQRAEPFGGVYGTTRLLQLPCGLIAVTTPCDARLSVKTVLTRAMAITSMHHRGVSPWELLGIVERRDVA